ncbi:hypothetical protein [Bacillus sp. FSL K6-3431]|uniref:hypothetical protein n=1 Tax=Bacillus sp. FSL K6-3431 TaxID=2921500 RepID=UPI0030F7EA27
MKIEIENGKLAAAINFMYDVKLVRKQSRFRRYLIEKLNDRLTVVEEDRKELLKDHSHKDGNGEAIINDGQYDVKDMVAFSNDLKELNQEKLVIEGGDNREMIRTIKVVLKKLEDIEYEGESSEIYDYLADQFDIDNEEETNEGEGKNDAN